MGILSHKLSGLWFRERYEMKEKRPMRRSTHKRKIESNTKDVYGADRHADASIRHPVAKGIATPIVVNKIKIGEYTSTMAFEETRMAPRKLKRLKIANARK